MAAYLGTTPVDVSRHDEFSHFTKADWALYFIQSYGQIEGERHKTWTLDQCARILNDTPVVVTEAHWDDGRSEYRVTLATPSDRYVRWRDEMLGGVEPDGSREYEYDPGIPP